MIWVGIIVVALTIIAIVKRLETRLVLLTAGLVMAVAAGKPLAAVDEFVKTMLHPTLVPVICTVMGFSYVMKLTGCDSHLVHLLTGMLKRWRYLLIPGAVVVTFAINIALPTAAGCAAAVGSILIPTLISAGIPPAMAASAVFAGTWGSTLSPGATHNPFVAKLANTDVMTVIAVLTPADLAALVVVTLCVTAMAYWRKETGSVGSASAGLETGPETFKVNPIKALIPLLPLALLILGSKQVGLLPVISVPQAMFAGVIIGMAVCWYSPQEVVKSFFTGMGDSYASIMGIIIAASVFTKGMELVGLTEALIDAMKHSQHIARIAATFGPFAVAVLSGTGDGAALAFNGAITPHAQQFGYGIIELGSVAHISGQLGRTMSPVAGAAIVCAQIAEVNPIEMTKRNALAMVLAALVVMFILL
jgi:DcuC family C4-dicarboxylate transporter